MFGVCMEISVKWNKISHMKVLSNETGMDFLPVLTMKGGKFQSFDNY